MNVSQLQINLRVAGQDPGAIDGLLGAKTLTALMLEIARPAGRENARVLGPMLAKELLAGGIWSPLRISHFLTQAAHESGGFSWLTELGGPTYCAQYDGRMGNGPGDGYRFRGRGIFQLTGHDNYAAFGPRIGVDLLAKPDSAAEPLNACRLAVLFWNDARLNLWADRDDILACSNGINRGNPKSTRLPNHFEERKDLRRRIGRLWG